MDYQQLPKACVILGAGASYDVWDRGALTRDPKLKPPLAKELFDITQKDAYQPILATYPGAHFLAQGIASKISSGEASIEQELLRLASHHDPRTKEQFKHIPPYLRDVLDMVSRGYVDIPSCYAQLVQVLLADYPHNVLFLLLNYDNLLEQALETIDDQFKFDSIANYTDPNLQAKVVKLHGSINWFRTFGTEPHDWLECVKQRDIFERIPEGQIIVDGGVRIVRNHGSAQKLYPLLTAPLAGKVLTDAACPTSHQTLAGEFLRDCKKFLIIGTSGLDADLLDLLDESIPDGGSISKYLVGGVEGIEATKDRFDNGVAAFRICSPGPNMEWKTYTGGFRQYVSSEGMRDFAEYEPL